MFVYRIQRTLNAIAVLLQGGIGERIQRIIDALNSIFQRFEVGALTIWASVGVIALVLLGFFSLYKTVMWVWKQPPAKDIFKEMGRLGIAFLIVLLNVGLPLGAIAVIPGAGRLVTDLFNAVFG